MKIGITQAKHQINDLAILRINLQVKCQNSETMKNISQVFKTAFRGLDVGPK